MTYPADYVTGLHHQIATLQQEKAALGVLNAGLIERLAECRAESGLLKTEKRAAQAERERDNWIGQAAMSAEAKDAAEATTRRLTHENAELYKGLAAYEEQVLGFEETTRRLREALEEIRDEASVQSSTFALLVISLAAKAVAADDSNISAARPKARPHTRRPK